MIRNFTSALLAAAALSIVAPNTSEAGWVKIHGVYVWVQGSGNPDDAPWHRPQKTRTQRVLTAPVSIRPGAAGPYPLATPLPRR